MSSICYSTKKKTGAKYAYIGETIWDPVNKTRKTLRIYLGRVDPITNEIIVKGEAFRTPINDSEIRKQLEKLLDKRARLDKEIAIIRSFLHDKSLVDSSLD